MKTCTKCGGTEFAFTSEQQFVKVDKPYGILTQFVVIILFLTIIFIPFALSILKNPKGFYVERIKTVATCKTCWQKHLIEDQPRQKLIQQAKLL